MYIDEIKKLLKDIEKSVQGDRRWIENEDYLLKDKMEKILEKDKSNINTQQPILIPNEFVFPQYQKKIMLFLKYQIFQIKIKKLLNYQTKLLIKGK